MRPKNKKAVRSRSIFYGWHLPDGAYSQSNIFDEVAMEKILAAAKISGLISEYDTGRGAVVWFEGTPGLDLRCLRDQVRAMLPDGVEPLAYDLGGLKPKKEKG